MVHDLAFVIGNGVSRLGYNIEALKNVAPTYGCNALYREFGPTYDFPDWIVAIDDGIRREIATSSFPQERVILPPPEECWEPAEMHGGRQGPRSNAGINAIREAIKTNVNMIVCLGFDFLILDEKKSISNIYDGTPNYGPETRAVFADNEGRKRYLQWVITRNPKVEFCFVFNKDLTTMPLMSYTGNVGRITYDELDSIVRESLNEHKANSSNTAA